MPTNNNSQILQYANASSEQATKLYADEKDQFFRLSRFQQATLATKHHALMKMMVQDESLGKEELAVILKPFPEEEAPFELQFSPALYLSAMKNAGVAFAAYDNQNLFNQLETFKQAEIIARHFHLYRKVFTESQLKNFGIEDLSYIASHYALAPDYPPHNKFHDWQREQVCLDFAKSPEILSSLYPAARFLLFSRIKQMHDFQQNPESLGLSTEVSRQIQVSYTLPLTDASIGGAWWLSAMCSDQGLDYAGRFDDVLRCAKGQTNYGEGELPEALAATILEDDRFIEGFQNSLYPDHPYAQFKLEDRLEVASMYPRLLGGVKTSHIIQDFIKLPGHERVTLEQKYPFLKTVSATDLAASIPLFTNPETTTNSQGADASNATSVRPRISN